MNSHLLGLHRMAKQKTSIERQSGRQKWLANQQSQRRMATYDGIFTNMSIQMG